MFKFFSRMKSATSTLLAEPTLQVSDEVKEQIVSTLTTVGFFDDSSLRYSLFDLDSYEHGDLEYTEMFSSIRFWASVNADNTFRQIHVVRHGNGAVPQADVDAVNQKLAALIS